MQLPNDVLRNVYRVVQLKSSIYCSELPGLYKEKCGSDLKYREMGFSQLPSLIEKCEPYIKRKFDPARGQWLLSIRKKLPRSIAQPSPLTPPGLSDVTEHGIRLALDFIFKGKFLAQKLLYDLDCITCSLCFKLTDQFQVWKLCHHVICRNCLEDSASKFEDSCRLCGRNFEDSIETGGGLITLPQNIITKILDLKCLCPFDHAKRQPMTLKALLHHFNQCPLNTQFTRGKVLEEKNLDDDDESLEEEEEKERQAQLRLVQEIERMVKEHIQSQLILTLPQLPKNRRKAGGGGVSVSEGGGGVSVSEGGGGTNGGGGGGTTGGTASGMIGPEIVTTPSSSMDGGGYGDSMEWENQDRFQRHESLEIPPDDDKIIDLRDEERIVITTPPPQEKVLPHVKSDPPPGLFKVVSAPPPPPPPPPPLPRVVSAPPPSEVVSAQDDGVMRFDNCTLFVYQMFQVSYYADIEFPKIVISVQPGEKVSVMALSGGTFGWLLCKKLTPLASETGWVPTQVFRKVSELPTEFSNRLFKTLAQKSQC